MKKIYIIFALIIVILILLFNLKYKKIENFYSSGGLNHVLGDADENITEADITDDALYKCTERGCLREIEVEGISDLEIIRSGSLTYTDCNEKCRFNFDQDAPNDKCVGHINGPDDDNYKTKSECMFRYICDDDAGKCIIGPASRENSYGTLDECKQRCFFKKSSSDSTCTQFDPVENPVDSNVRSYQYKEDCEERYECIGNKCRRQADGIFETERQCKLNCEENLRNINNNNKIELEFDVRIDNMYEYNKNKFEEKLRTFLEDQEIDNQKILESNDILGFTYDNRKLIIVFLNYISDVTKINKIFEKIKDNLFSLIVNYTEYNIIKIKNRYCLANGGSDCEITRSDSLPSSNKYLIFEIEGTFENIRQKIFDFNVVETIDTSNTLTEKLNYLEELENNLSQTDANFNVLEITKLFNFQEQLNLYRNNTNNINNYVIKIQDIDENFINILKSKLYYNTSIIESIRSNFTELKALTISNSNRNSFFEPINEIMLILYKNNNSMYKFAQIPIDLNKKRKLYFLEQKYRINTEKINAILTQNDFNIINNVSIEEEDNFENTLTNLDTSEQLKMSLKITYFENDLLIKEIIYHEENDVVNRNFTCNFNPRGETIFNCITLCENERNCSSNRCSELCNNCENLDCKWNITDFNAKNEFRPDPPKIKCFSGNGSIKITWIRPFSIYLPDTYYIILINTNLNSLDIYKYDSIQELNEYIITGLKNDTLYDIKVLSKNKYGVSELSNTETIIPNRNNKLEQINEIKLSEYEDSIESFYRNTPNFNPVIQNVDIKNRIALLEEKIVLNDLQEILNTKIGSNGNLLNTYDINVY